MFRHYHKDVRRALTLAQGEAVAWNHGYLGCEHLLVGLLGTSGSTAATVLSDLEVDAGQTRAQLADLVCLGTVTVRKKRLPRTPRAKQAITSYAHQEARTLRHHTIGTEHLLLALLRDRENLAANLLERMGLQPDQVRQAVLTQVHISNQREERS